MLMKSIKQKAKQRAEIRSLYSLVRSWASFFNLKPIQFFRKNYWFISQFLSYISIQEKNTNFKAFELYPCYFDNLDYTPIDPVYFYQDCWFADHIFRLKPEHHVDVGSSLKTIGIISQYIPVTMVDIRPPYVKLPNLHFIRGSILDLPFRNESVSSLSSLCVIEHIGLGRYGDDLDQFGTEKAVKEIKRVLKPNGLAFISLPVDSYNKVYFNAHRAFSRQYITHLFEGFDVLEEKYIYGFEIFDSYDREKGFGTGLFLLRKKGGT